MANKLQDIFHAHEGKVSDKWDSYLHHYETIFESETNKPINLLEIGVQNGGSLEIWAKYFDNAKSIIGVDINRKVAELQFSDPRIRVHVCNATDPQCLELIDQKSFPLDILIDDGSHVSKDIIKSFMIFFPQLSDQGIYVIEDIQCSYYKEYEGSLFGNNTAMAFFKRIADVINKEHWDVNKSYAELLQPIAANYNIDLGNLDWLSTIHSVQFSNSIITITKQPPNHNLLGTELIAGTIENVVPGRLAHSGVAYHRENFSSLPTDDATLLDNILIIENLISENKKLIKSSTRNKSKIKAQNTQIKQTLETLKETDLLAKARLQSVNELTNAIQEKDASISQLANANQSLNEQVSNLASDNQALQTTISAIKASSSWRVTSPFRVMSNYAQLPVNYLKIFTKKIKDNGGISHLASVTRKSLKNRGLAATLRKIRATLFQGPLANISINMPAVIDPKIVSNGPKISVIIPIYNTPLQFLNECIRSVRNQSYQNWELILVDDKSPSPNVRDLMMDHAEQDDRIKTVFRKANGHISKTVNDGLKHVTGEYYTVLDHDDTINPDALYWVAEYIVNNKNADYLYSDEDKLHENGTHTFGPFYKPAWSPEYMLSMMYTCHMSVFRTKLAREIGGYRSEFDGTQDYDFTLRFVAKTKNIIHIPKILYHWRVWANSTAQDLDSKPYAFDRQRKALENYLDMLEENYEIHDNKVPGHHTVIFKPKKNDLISIVIPTANGTMKIGRKTEFHIDAVVESITSKSTYTNYEIVIVHNGDLSKKQTTKFSAIKNVQLVHYKSKTFSLADKINLGCKKAKGEYLLILNDDIRVITPDWLERMLGVAQRDGVGVVGAKLLFPNDTIQHAGVVVLGGLPGHVYYEEPEDYQGYALGAAVDRNYIAVTGACQLTSKKLFFDYGGYSPRYPLNYNDVDYCLKLHEAGYRAVCLADVTLYHYEGVSKDGGRSVGHGELEKFLSDWHEKLPHDPYYNPNLNQQRPYGA